MWINPNEIPDNGIDDDGNGFIDDLIGYDFENNDPHAEEEFTKFERITESGWNETAVEGGYPVFHGTHVGGIILANSRYARLIAIKGNVIAAKAWRDITRYLNNTPIDILNMSMGVTRPRGQDPEYFPTMPGVRNAIDSNPGTLFTFAAGNSHIDLDSNFRTEHVPASYAFSNMIVVAASDGDTALNLGEDLGWSEGDEGEREYFSNFGMRSVDIVAPRDSRFERCSRWLLPSSLRYIDGCAICGCNLQRCEGYTPG